MSTKAESVPLVAAVHVAPAAGTTPPIQRGQWSDGLFDCFNYGYCVPQCCLTFWFHTCAMGQLLQRLRLNWIGEESETRSRAFRTWLILTVVYLVVNAMLGQSVEVGHYDMDFGKDEVDEPEGPIAFLINLINGAFGILSLVALCKLRSVVRRRHSIPTTTLLNDDCEDCLCAFCCSGCVICQVARHTTPNYADSQYCDGLCDDEEQGGGQTGDGLIIGQVV